MRKKSILIILSTLLLLVGCGSKSKGNSDNIDSIDKNNNEQIQEENKETSNKYDKVINEVLGVEITYPSNIFTYNDNSNESNSISFMSEIDKSGEIPNIFLSVSTSEYNVQDTEEGLKLQAFSENIKVEDITIGKDSIDARKIKVSEENNQGRIVYYYVLEREDNKNTYIIEVDTISDDNGTEKYIDEFEKMLNSFSFTSKEVIQENLEEVRNMAMGFSFSVSKDFFTKLISGGVNTDYSKEFQADLDKEIYYVDISGIEQEMFIIYRIDKKYTEQEVKNINPKMTYLGTDSNATFAIMYAEGPNKSLSDKGSSEFNNLMENEVPSVAKSFVIDAN